MDDRYRDDTPRRSVRLAGPNGGGAHGDRPPLPLGVNERTRGVGARPTDGRRAGNPYTAESPHRAVQPEFRPSRQMDPGAAPVYRGPRPGRPAGESPDRATRREADIRHSGRPAPRDPNRSTRPNPNGRPAGPGHRTATGNPTHPSREYRGQAPRQQRPLSGSYAHTPSRHRSGAARGGYPSTPYRGRRGSDRIFSRPTWQSLLFSPRGIALVLALVVIGAGGLGIHNSIQRNKAEEAARIEAAEKKERLAKQRVDPSRLGPTAVPVSTPKAEWKAGSMPHLYQTDPVWASQPYAGTDVRTAACGPTSLAMVYVYLTGKTDLDPASMAAFATDPVWASQPYAGTDVRTAACGPTSLAMVYVYLTGKTDLDPASMAAFADERNFAPTGATEWRFMTEGASLLGLKSTAVSPNRASVASALKSDKPVICSVSPGDFTSIGHFIVLKSIDERGMVEVYDPNSALNSTKRWPINRILAQASALWCFSL